MSTALPMPSAEEVLREIRQFSPTMQLYRGADVWFRFEHAGRDYYFPPDIPGKTVPHPVTGEMVKADGILRVRDTYGRQQEKLSRRFTGGYGLLEGQEVSAILMFAITQFGDKGVVWLHGDDTDELRRKASRAAVRNHQKAWAEHQREARASFVENWQKLPQNKGRRVPPPTDPQRRAQRFLDLLAEEGAEGYEFVCEHGCSDFESFEDYARHMKVNHQKVVRRPEEQVQEVAPAAPKLDDSPIGGDPVGDPAAAVAEAAKALEAKQAEKIGTTPDKKAPKTGK